MKKIVIILFFSFFLLSAASARAGTVSLVTHYPAPVGAYNKVHMKTQANPNCANAANKGALFVDTTPAGNPTENLEVCDGNGNSTVYPQQCYNSFCNYVNGAVIPCVPACAGGYQPMLGPPDQFPIDAATITVAQVCCRTCGASGGGACTSWTPCSVTCGSGGVQTCLASTGVGCASTVGQTIGCDPGCAMGYTVAADPHNNSENRQDHAMCPGTLGHITVASSTGAGCGNPGTPGAGCVAHFN
ncbi:MAG: hypothetical protein HQL14_04590 [Candidatus Omnitrophica bacterium]|nr:hypothetical protein [Candidatus Omnitrophota bacterium]